jgi:hypothetical protein
LSDGSDAARRRAAMGAKSPYAAVAATVAAAKAAETLATIARVEASRIARLESERLEAARQAQLVKLGLVGELSPIFSAPRQAAKKSAPSRRVDDEGCAWSAENAAERRAEAWGAARMSGASVEDAYADAEYAGRRRRR